MLDRFGGGRAAAGGRDARTVHRSWTGRRRATLSSSGQRPVRRRLALTSRPPIRPLLLLCSLQPLGCPNDVASRPTQAHAAAAPEADGGDVIERNGHLYPARSARSAQYGVSEQPKGSEQPAPGSGRPDETNGTCRLYAPELPEPQCCSRRYGLDAAFVRETCGHNLYLGESFHASCGYWFHANNGRPVPVRLAFVPQPTVDEAVSTHLRKLARTGTGTPTVEPVPGVPDATWIHHDEYHWAFIPGWTDVRQLGWMSYSCSQDAMAKVIANIRVATEPKPGSPRPLVPTTKAGTK